MCREEERTPGDLVVPQQQPCKQLHLCRLVTETVSAKLSARFDQVGTERPAWPYTVARYLVNSSAVCVSFMCVTQTHLDFTFFHLSAPPQLCRCDTVTLLLASTFMHKPNHSPLAADGCGPAQ